MAGGQLANRKDTSPLPLAVISQLATSPVAVEWHGEAKSGEELQAGFNQSLCLLEVPMEPSEAIFL